MIQHPVSSVNEEHAETERDIKMIVMRADDQHARTKACVSVGRENYDIARRFSTDRIAMS